MRLVKFLIFSFVVLMMYSCEQSIDDMINEGVTLSKQNKNEEAVKLFTKVIQKNDKIQLAYYNRGISYAELKDYHKALADFNTIIDLQPKGAFVLHLNPNTPFADEETKTQVSYEEALYQKAIVEFDMDSIQKSFRDFQTCINNNHEVSNSKLWQGTTWIKGGDKSTACYYFQKALELATNKEDSSEAYDMIDAYCK